MSEIESETRNVKQGDVFYDIVDREEYIFWNGKEMTFSGFANLMKPMAGIDDVAGFMEKIHEVVYKLNHHLLLKEDYKKLHNEALALFPPNEEQP